MSKRWLTYADLQKRYSKTRVTIYRWVRAGILPRPKRLGPNSVGWDEEALDARDAELEDAA